MQTTVNVLCLVCGPLYLAIGIWVGFRMGRISGLGGLRHCQTDLAAGAESMQGSIRQVELLSKQVESLDKRNPQPAVEVLLGSITALRAQLESAKSSLNQVALRAAQPARLPIRSKPPVRPEIIDADSSTAHRLSNHHLASMASEPAAPDPTGQRALPRYNYRAMQFAAPLVDDELPSLNAFQPIQCEDLSATGLQFITKRMLPRNVVVTLGDAHNRAFMAARVVRHRVVDTPEGSRYAVSCQFTRRLTDLPADWKDHDWAPESPVASI